MAHCHLINKNLLRERLPLPVYALTISLAACLAAACSKTPDQPKTSELKPIPITNSPAPAFSPAQATPSAKPAESPPKTDEVIAAIARAFEKSLTIAQTAGPVFLTGDFNGDGSEDIAVITKAKQDSLGEINSAVANWTLEDPHDVPIPGTPAADQLVPPKPVKAEKTDSLLAIIHGVGAQGWRNDNARQAFLLRNAAGVSATVQTSNAVRAAPFKQKLPPLRGDVILETVNGRRGLIFWTGAKYSWAPEQ